MDDTPRTRRPPVSSSLPCRRRGVASRPRRGPMVRRIAHQAVRTACFPLLPVRILRSAIPRKKNSHGSLPRFPPSPVPGGPRRLVPRRPARHASAHLRLVQESDAAHPGRSTSAVVPRPGHATAGFHTRGRRAEESPGGLLEGGGGSPCLPCGYDTSGQGPCRSGAAGHPQQTMDFSVGAQAFGGADGAVWRLLRDVIRARAQGISERTLRDARGRTGEAGRENSVDSADSV
jgi:hypothetical protein